MQCGQNIKVLKEEDIQVENKYMKDAMHHVFRELQILNNSEIPLHTYWNGQIPKYWQHQMLVRLWNKRNCHLLLAEKQNGTATLGDSLVFSYKAKHTIQQLHSSVFAKMG